MRVSLVAALLLSSCAGFGQTGLATVTGTVTDPTGAAVANASIVVHSLDTGSNFEGASSTTGNYTVTQLPVGDYELSVTVSGFKKYTHTKFHLAAGQTMGEDVALQVGQTSESITVSAETSLLQTESSELAGNFCLECNIAIAPLAPEGGAATQSQSPSSTELRTIR
jgi:hypothetical protein